MSKELSNVATYKQEVTVIAIDRGHEFYFQYVDEKGLIIGERIEKNPHHIDMNMVPFGSKCDPKVLAEKIVEQLEKTRRGHGNR